MNPFRKWRESRNLTRRDVAVLLGVSVSHVQAVETGIVAHPYRSLLEAFTTVAGSSTADQLAHDYAVWRDTQRVATLAKIHEG